MRRDWDLDSIIWPEYPGRLVCGCDLDNLGDAVLCAKHEAEMEAGRS